MRSAFLILFGSVVLLSCKTTNIYLVRHAEKAAQPADNPHLTNEGKTRAIALRDALTDKNIQNIYSTNYNRTRETAEPLASSKGITVQSYGNDTLAKFLNKVKGLKGNTLIVAHSNTSITILDSLHVNHSITNIPDNDYDNLFIIKVKNGQVKSVTESTYGAISPVGGASGVMK